PFLREVVEADIAGRIDVAEAGNDTVRAGEHGVVTGQLGTGEDGEIVDIARVHDDGAEVRLVAAAVLEAGDYPFPRELDDGGALEHDLDIGRDVVGEHRNIHSLAQGAEVPLDLFLVRSDVERGGRDHGVRAQPLGDAGVLQHGGGAHVDDAGDDRDLPGGVTHGDVEDLLALRIGEGGHLAGGAEDEEAVDAAVQQV